MKNILISFVFCFLFSQEKDVLDGVVAVVGDNIITKGDYFYQLSVVANQKNISPSLTPLKYEKLASLVLDDIIDRYVLLEYAEKDSSIVVDSDLVQQQLDNQINMFVQNVGSIDSLEAVFGKPIQNIRAEYWDEIYNAMLIERYRLSLTGGFSVGKKEVEVFYEQYKDSLPPAPANGNFSIYNISFDPSINTLESSRFFVSSLLDSVSRGLVSFEKIIENHSDDIASIPLSGVVGYTERGSLFPEYEAAAYSIKVGEFVGPVKTQAGYHIIKLLDKRGNKINTQHLLKRVIPTALDREKTGFYIMDIYEKSKADPLFLENYIDEGAELSGESLSGNYNNLPLSRLPDELYNIIKNSEDSKLYEPIILQNETILLLYVYEVFPEKEASLNDSYDFIKSSALNKKIMDYLASWLINAREGVYINTFKE